MLYVYAYPSIIWLFNHVKRILFKDIKRLYCSVGFWKTLAHHKKLLESIYHHDNRSRKNYKMQAKVSAIMYFMQAL